MKKKALKEKRPKEPRKKRHQLAKTEVDVFRLFKIRDLAKTLSYASDTVIQALGQQIYEEARRMLKPYCVEQGEIMLAQQEREQQKIERETKQRVKK